MLMKALVVALFAVNASIFWRERGKPNYLALIGANLVVFVPAIWFVILVEG